MAESHGRILLVDDDSLFGKVMSAYCQRHSISVTYVQSVRDAYRLSDLNYDVAIIDYDLGCVTGVQLTHFFEHYAKLPAVILVSASHLAEDKEWPECVKCFVQKSEGVSNILAEVMKFLPKPAPPAKVL